MTENIINKLNEGIEGHFLTLASVFGNNTVTELEQENEQLRKELKEARSLAQSWRDSSWASMISDLTIPPMNGKPVLPWEEE